MDEMQLTKLAQILKERNREHAAGQTTNDEALQLIRNYKELRSANNVQRVEIEELHERLGEQLNTIKDLKNQQQSVPVYEPVPHGVKEGGVALYNSGNNRGSIIYGDGNTHIEITLPAGWVVCKKAGD